MSVHRRDFLAGLGAAALPAAAQSRPANVIVILADDLGYGDLSCYGGKTATPNLDRMAAEGVRFTNFYTPMPFCAPTRASLLTGRYPFRNGMIRNPAPDGGANFGLSLSEVTLADVMKKAGYATTCIGKWHLGHTPEFLPRKRGFDSYYGIPYSNDMRPVQVLENEAVAEYPVMQATLTRRYTDRAISFVERNRERPFFLYLPHAMPHKPLAASEDFYTPDTPGDLYADVLRELDANVGRLMEGVRRAGVERNTLVVFTSDNGPWFGGNTNGLRGMKARSWEGGIRVPMIARWPGVIPAGRTTGELGGIIDLLPTACAAAGVAVPGGRTIDGRNLMPLLRGETDKSPHEALVAMGGDQLRVIRSGRWKLHVRSPGPENGYMADASGWVDPRGPDGVTIVAPYEQARPSQYPGLLTGDAPKPMMLFDLEADPGEQHDVAAQHPEVVGRLKAWFERLDADVPKLPQPARSPLRRLKGGSLNYDLDATPPK